MGTPTTNFVASSFATCADSGQNSRPRCHFRDEERPSLPRIQTRTSESCRARRDEAGCGGLKAPKPFGGSDLYKMPESATEVVSMRGVERGQPAS